MKGAALEAVLDAYPGEAYVVRANGRVELANPLGTARIRADAKDVLGGLARSVRGEGNGFALRPIEAPGLPPSFLATRPPGPQDGLDARLEHARRAWRLTPRETEVLRCLAAGDPNKDIAQLLALSHRTVEVHIAALTRKARVDSRLRLVARLWQGA
jgi:DNA-binding CsgD family transcriptional regulator